MTIKNAIFVDNTTHDELYTLKDAKKAIQKRHTIKVIGTIDGGDFFRSSRIASVDEKSSSVKTENGSVYRVLL